MPPGGDGSPWGQKIFAQVFQQQQQKISNIKEPNLKFASAFKILDRRQVAAFPQKVECHNLASSGAEPFAQMTPILRGGIVLLCLQ